MNVFDSEAAMAELHALGARSVPVVSRGEQFVFAQVIADVVEFLGLDEPTGPSLEPDTLAQRWLSVSETALTATRQMPPARLDDELPNRPRSWRVLMHHTFQLVDAWLDMEASGEPMQHAQMVAPPPDGMVTPEHVARFGERVRSRFEQWAKDNVAGDFERDIEVYFGTTTRHEMLERTVWHSTQHVRQVVSLLEQAGVEPTARVTDADIAGLPLTQKIWD